MFCSPFDEALATVGPAAIFLLDQEGLLRFDPSWTRDCWGRAPGPHEHQWTWTALRDQGTGFVFVVLVTSMTLLLEHPRLDVRQCATRSEALAFAVSFGDPAIAEAAAWC